MAQPNILELAKQGDARAIANLMNRSVQLKGITAKAVLKDGCLQVMLDAAQVPEKLALVSFIRKSMASLGAESIERVKVYGRQTGEEFPDWSQEFELGTQVKSKAVQGNQSLDLPGEPGLSALPQQKPVTKVVTTRTHNAQAAGQTKTSKNYGKTNSKDRQKSLRWYETDSPVLIIALLIIFFPLGLYSMWRYSKWSLKVKLSVTAAIAFLALVSNGFEEKTPFATSPTSITERPATEPSSPESTSPTIADTSSPSASSATPDICNLPYQALYMDIYRQYIHEGMSHAEVSAVVGNPGEEVSSAGATVIYQWHGAGKHGYTIQDSSAIMTVTFQDDKLVSKSQVGLN